MKIAYLDCPTGLSGNMILASLIDAGLSLSYLKSELKKLKIGGYSIDVTNTRRKGLTAKHLEISLTRKEPHRSINEICGIIRKSGLRKKIKDKSLEIFKRLYDAERAAHGRSMTHLHETGATDAIIDIVGAVIGFDRLGIEEIYCSSLPFGTGKIKSSHGDLPNPAPATVRLLKGIPVYRKNIRAELVTPTGAAIIATLAKSFTDMPKLRLERTGHGAGTFDLKEPNILRLFIGRAEPAYNTDLVYAIETNIDNMNPELYDHVIKKLIKAGALDAYIAPIIMKNNRAAVTLTALSPLDRKERLTDIIFRETTTLGVRTYLLKRDKLERESRNIRTKYGRVRVKIGKSRDNIYNIAPEYADCAKASMRSGVPIKKIYDSARDKIS